MRILLKFIYVISLSLLSFKGSAQLALIGPSNVVLYDTEQYCYPTGFCASGYTWSSSPSGYVTITPLGAGGAGKCADITFDCFPPSGQVTISCFNSCSGVTVSLVITVSIDPTDLPSNVSVSNNTICEGEQITLSATCTAGGTSINWYTNSTGTGPPVHVGSPWTFTPGTTGVNTYYVACVNPSLCIIPPTPISFTVNPSPTVSVNSATICEGSSTNLSATFSPAGGTFSWAPGGGTSGTISVNPTTTTTYTVTYTAPNGCTKTATGTVTVNPTPTVLVNSVSVCIGATGTLIATTSPAGGTFSWLPTGGVIVGSTYKDNPAATTTYTVTYTAPNGCTNTGTGTITVNPKPTVSVNSILICSGASGTLTATTSPAGGSYSWLPTGGTIVGNTYQDNPTTPTTYTVSYTDLNGCTSTGTGTINVNPSPTITVTNDTACIGSNGTLVATPSVAGGIYSWAPVVGFGPSFSDNPTSTTTYTVTYTAPNGCTTTGTGTIVITPGPTVTVNSAGVCFGDAATLTATPSIGGGTYSWSPTGSTNQSITQSPNSTTVYTVSYSLGACVSTATGTIIVKPLPTVSVTSATICNGTSATITATPSIPGGIFSWAPLGSSGPTLTQNPATTTSYTVTYTAPNGCTATAIGTITVSVSPTVTVNSATICNGNSATLTANPSIGGGTYLWNPSGSTNSSITQSPSSTTTYTVTYTAPNGCTNTATGTITVNPVPSISVNSVTVCNGTSATLTATPSIGGGTYSWNPTAATTQSITETPGTTTTYTVTYTAPNGCTATATGVITVIPIPTVSATSASVCLGSSGTLVATPSTSGGTYSWTPGGTTTASMTDNPATTTTYTVTYTVPGGCTATNTGTITVNLLPTVSVNSTTICSGTSGTITATPSIAGGTYSWNPSNSASSSLTISPLSTTTYTVTYTAPNGCTATGTGTITVNQSPTVSVSSAAICNGLSTSITATPSVAGGTYLWNPTGGTSASLTDSPGSTTTYTVTYTAPNGCTSTGLGTITVTPAPTVASNSTTICSGNSTTLNATPSVGGGTYSWSPGGGTNNSITDSPGSTTTYTVTYSLNGCSATSTSLVIVNPSPTVTSSSDTICNGASSTITATPSVAGGTYLWNPTGSTSSSLTDSPITTTTYTVTYTASNGCTTTNTGTILVNPTPSVSVNTVNICSGLSATLNATPSFGGGTYLWNPGGGTNNSITDSPVITTTYTVTYTSSSGCSSTGSGIINVTPTPSVSVNADTVCNGISGTIVATPTIPNGNYNWIPSLSSTNTLTDSPANTTTYTVTYTSSGGCTATGTGTITVKPTPVVSINSLSICYGETDTLVATPSVTGGTYLWSPSGTTNDSISVNPTSTSTYTVSYTAPNGCSSSGTATVIVNPVESDTINQNICSGNSYAFNGQNLTIAGTYFDTLSTVKGCDSLITLNLSIVPNVTGILNQTICTGNTYSFNGQNLISSGSYLDTLVSVAGCDSILTLNLTVNPPLTGTTNQTICTGSSFLFNGQSLTTAGTYLDTLSNAQGCDSIVTLNLTINPPLTGTSNQTICKGSSYLFNGQNLTTTGTYYDTVSTIQGCDSIITLNLTVNPPLTGTLNQNICIGSSYFFNGQNLTNSGIYFDTLTTSGGCDSIITLNLAVLPHLSSVVNKNICAGTSYLFNGQSLVTTGSYMDTLTSASGCDSIITLNLTINPPLTGSYNHQICIGNSYLFNGQNLTSTGIYKDTISNVQGCDSIVTLNLSVVQYLTSVINQSACSGTSYNFNGQSITVAGTYFDTLTTSAGCDSIITLNLTFTPYLTGVVNQTICTGSSYYFNGQTLTSPGTYLDTLTSVSGCDSIVTLNLSYSSYLTSSSNHTICEGQSYNFHGQNLTTTGTYVDTLITSGGCDSVVTVNLIVYPSPYATISPNTTINIGNSTTLIATGYGSYNWYPSTGLDTTSGNTVVATPTVTTTYCVIVTSLNSCVDTACVTVTVENPCPENAEDLSVANAFSPNNDGINDIYCIQGWGDCVESFYIVIYNRWGEKLYESIYPDFCWNGTYEARIVDAQVVVYYITAKIKNQDVTISKQGNISIIR